MTSSVHGSKTFPPLQGVLNTTLLARTATPSHDRVEPHTSIATEGSEEKNGREDERDAGIIEETSGRAPPTTFGAFLGWITRKKGLTYNSYRFLKAELRNRFEAHMRDLKVEGYTEYAAQVENSPELWKEMDVILTIDIRYGLM